jgi:hypothetical protein
MSSLRIKEDQKSNMSRIEFGTSRSIKTESDESLNSGLDIFITIE